MHPPLHVSRRRFLQLAAAAPCGIAFGAETFAPPLAVFSKVYQEVKLTPEQSAEVTAEVGLDGIDCGVRPNGEILPEHAADEMPRYADLLRRHNVRMLLLTTGITSVASAHAETILRTAQKLGIKYYRLNYWKHTDGTPMATVKAQLKDLAALNREVGVCALYQNHSEGKKQGHGYFGSNLAELYEIVQDFAPEQVGVAFDLGHALLTHGDDWSAHFEKLKPWIKVAYLKDVQRGTGFVPFGTGEFSRTDFFHRLRQMNYRAPLSIHIEFDWVAKGQPKNRAALVKTLTDSRRVVGQWLSQA